MSYGEHFEFVVRTLNEIETIALKRNDRETLKWIKGARASLFETDMAFKRLQQSHNFAMEQLNNEDH